MPRFGLILGGRVHLLHLLPPRQEHARLILVVLPHPVVKEPLQMTTDLSHEVLPPILQHVMAPETNRNQLKLKY